MIHCVKLGREAEAPDFSSFARRTGQTHLNKSQRKWQAGSFQTMLINENRLSLADPRARKYGLTSRILFLRHGCRHAGRIHAAQGLTTRHAHIVFSRTLSQSRAIAALSSTGAFSPKPKTNNCRCWSG